MGTLMKLSATNPIARRVMDAFNAGQPRDERGRFGTGGPGSGAKTVSEHKASAASHTEKAKEHYDRGEFQTSKLHEVAAHAHNLAAGAPAVYGYASEHTNRSMERAQNFSRAANAASRQAAASVKANRESAKVK